MNPVLMLTRNNLALTKKAVISAQLQDIPCSVHIIDNGSTDGTVEWSGRLLMDAAAINAGVSAGWNHGLAQIFERHDHCLVINNDVILPRWFYRELLSYHEASFVSGISVDDLFMIAEPPVRMALSPNPDFSAFLIWRDCWEKVGPFDERMRLYASDCDFHIRAHRADVPLYKAHVPYYHERSSTLNNASAGDREEIETQANEDRAMFKSIYGCLPGTFEYGELFK